MQPTVEQARTWNRSLTVQLERCKREALAMGCSPDDMKRVANGCEHDHLVLISLAKYAAALKDCYLEWHYEKE